LVKLFIIDLVESYTWKQSKTIINLFITHKKIETQVIEG
jgi:hypothetical protein